MLLYPDGRPRDPNYITDSFWAGPVEVQWSLSFPMDSTLDPNYVSAAKKYIPDYIAPSTVPDPRLVAEIRKFYPRYVPLWCTRIHISPDGKRIPWGYHVIGGWFETPDPEDPDPWRIVKVARPPNFPFQGGIIYEHRTMSHPWPNDTMERMANTPDIPVAGPTTPAFVEWMREMYKIAKGSLDTVKEHLRKRIESESEAKQKAMDDMEDRSDYRWKEMEKLYQLAVDEGRIFNAPREYEAQPYV